MEKGKKDIKEPTHVLTTKFDILKKSERPVCPTRTSDFYNDKTLNIFKWISSLYISQVRPCRHVLGYACISQIIWLNFTQTKKICETMRG
jgi:hypothetical protein